MFLQLQPWGYFWSCMGGIHYMIKERGQTFFHRRGYTFLLCEVAQVFLQRGGGDQSKQALCRIENSKGSVGPWNSIPKYFRADLFPTSRAIPCDCVRNLLLVDHRQAGQGAICGSCSCNLLFIIRIEYHNNNAAGLHHGPGGCQGLGQEGVRGPK